MIPAAAKRAVKQPPPRYDSRRARRLSLQQPADPLVISKKWRSCIDAAGNFPAESQGNSVNYSPHRGLLTKGWPASIDCSHSPVNPWLPLNVCSPESPMSTSARLNQ